ncbi:VWA domain-containing protein [Vibrio sp. WXL103]|uniref:VWA domain-containing protein n=1 Tax=Vibrio sp. WXL103 TaxID=3450710 RepID=UPI003EC71301
MSQFHFIRPEWLLLLIPLAALVYITLKSNQKASMDPLIAPHLRESVLTKSERQRLATPNSLFPIVLAILVLMVAGPTLRPENQDLIENDSITTILFDLSPSMNEIDIAPTRYANAKIKLEQAVSHLDERIAIWGFASSAHLALPPTKDKHAAGLYIDALSPSIMPTSGNNLGSALETLASEPYYQSPQATSLVLITDSLSSVQVEQLKRHHQTSHQNILVWQFGFEPMAALPFGIGLINSHLHNDDAQMVAEWISKQRIFDPQDEDIQWQELGYFLVWPMLMIVMYWFRRGWTIKWYSLVLGVSLVNFSPPTLAAQINCSNWLLSQVFTSDQLGRYHYQKGNYHCAAWAFEQPHWRVEALFKAKRWEDAALTLEQINQTDPSAESHLKLGVAYANLQRFRSAQQQFLLAQKLAPQNTDILHNLGLIEEIFSLMEQRARGQGTAGEDMTADMVQSMQEDMGIDEPEDKIEVINSADLMAEEHLTKIWLEQVKTDHAQFLKRKFSQQYFTHQSENK